MTHHDDEHPAASPDHLVDLTMAPWLRTLFRVPLHLYDLHLGVLLGHRFLQLEQRGATLGLPRRAVLEVVSYDRRTREATVLSGFGERADWLLNVETSDHAFVTIGRQRFAGVLERVPLAEAEDVIDRYARRNRWAPPIIQSVLSRLVGWRYDWSADARARLVRRVPVLTVRPTNAQRGADGSAHLHELR